MNEKEKGEVQIATTETDRLTPPSPPQSPQEQRGSISSITYADNGHAHAERSATLRYLLLSIDLVLAFSPLLFLGIAFAALAYNGKPQDKQNLVTVFDPASGQYVREQATGLEAVFTTRGGNAVIAAAKIAVSVFPILFAAIVGRFLKSYAMHRAERGAPMGMLEQFYGSQSLSNAVQLTYALKGPGIVGLGVVVLWLLSPLGGQATQRVLDKETAFNLSSGNVYYTNTSATNGAFANHFQSGASIDNVYATLSAAMLSDTIAQDTDVWGNVKIPYFEALSTQGYDLASIANGSRSLSVSSGTTSSSMVGLLVNNVTSLTYTQFTTKTSYVNLTCEEPRTWNYSNISSAADNATQPSQDQLQPYYDFLTWANLVDNLANGTNSDAASVDNTTDLNQFWTTWSFNVGVQTNGSNNNSGNPIPTFNNPPTFVYAAQDSYIITAYRCASRVVWVESDVLCNAGGSCGIFAMRNSTRPQAIEVDPIFDESDNDNGHGFPLQRMLGYLNDYSSSGASGIINPIQWYLTGASNLFPTDGGVPDYTQVPASLMASKLGTLLNTFWLIGLQRAAVSQPRTTNATMILASENNSTSYDMSSSSYLGYDVTGAYATFTSPRDIYAVNWPFVVIAIIISLMLLFLGFLGIYYRYTNSLPDVLGYVSTLTRDNPNFETPPDAHKSDGLEMANYYKSMRVQLVSTATNDDRGRITLRPLRRTSVNM